MKPTKCFSLADYYSPPSRRLPCYGPRRLLRLAHPPQATERFCSRTQRAERSADSFPSVPSKGLTAALVERRSFTTHRSIRSTTCRSTSPACKSSEIGPASAVQSERQAIRCSMMSLTQPSSRFLITANRAPATIRLARFSSTTWSNQVLASLSVLMISRRYRLKAATFRYDRSPTSEFSTANRQPARPPARAAISPRPTTVFHGFPWNLSPKRACIPVGWRPVWV